MKERRIMVAAFLLLLVLIFIVNSSISLVSAAGFSPSSLVFNSVQNQESCQTITLVSDSDKIIVSDAWAENNDVEWQTTKFITSASSHGISINYPAELGKEQRQFNVCVSAANVGEYHGVILMKEEQKGNSIIQMGVWLKLVISAPSQAQTSSSQTQGQTSGGAGGGAQASQTSLTGTPQAKLSDAIVYENISLDGQNQNSGITGDVVGEGKREVEGILTIVIMAALALVFIAFIFIYKRRKNRWKRGY